MQTRVDSSNKNIGDENEMKGLVEDVKRLKLEVDNLKMKNKKLVAKNAETEKMLSYCEQLQREVINIVQEMKVQVYQLTNRSISLPKDDEELGYPEVAFKKASDNSKDMEHSWAIVKFPEEEDVVAIVPTSWLHENECYWPPWSQDRINSAIKNCKPPDVETWTTHSFLPMTNNVFADFESAKKKMKKATETSDLESQTESQSEQINTKLKKRKILKTTVTRFASFEVSEGESNETLSVLPEPPKFKGSLKKKKPETSCDNEVADNADHENLATIVNPPVIRTSSVAPDMQQMTEYLKKIIKKQNIIQSSLAELAEDVTEIKNKLGENSQSTDEDVASIFTAITLPVNSETDLEQLKTYLSADLMMTTAVKQIALSGGKNVYELIYMASQKLLKINLLPTMAILDAKNSSNFVH